MYDTFLYGYGLTLAVSSQLLNSVKLTSRQRQYLFFSSFFREFVTSDEHRKVYRDFLKYFKINPETAYQHTKTKKDLLSKLEAIEKYGFERWVSKNLFENVDSVDSKKKAYLYMLYNYWGHLWHTNILQVSEVQNQLCEISKEILRVIRFKKQIYTTNFDNVLDEYLKPQHLHGIFSLPLNNMEDIIHVPYPDGKSFEYSFLFGTNGFEKLSRLNTIHTLKQRKYELDFFFNLDMDLGHLLIYGLSFGLSEFYTDEFFNKYPEHENEYFLRSVDGHILLKLNERFQKNKLSRITVTYYTDDDLEHLKYLFSMTEFYLIVNFKPSSEIFAL